MSESNGHYDLPDLAGDWPHQIAGIHEILGLFDFGASRICCTSPTGGGKTRMMTRMIQWATGRGWRTALYTNRRLLLEQTCRVLEQAGIDHGVRAAGHAPALLRDVQISSIQTESSRVLKKQDWDLHGAQLVLIDEAHVQKEQTAQRIMQEHLATGAKVVGFTATPLDVGHLYDHLVIAGSNSDCRKCGALVPAVTFGPDEPDTRKLKRQANGEFSENAVRKVIKPHVIWGRVYDWFNKLNPDGLPTLLFAPGVAESQWFAEEFCKKGVTAAHIDGTNIWTNGQTYKSTQEGRDELLQASREGDIRVICNRFVMREGVDAPWMQHCIMATVMGSLQTFLQSGGRMLRACHGKQKAVIVDHGGNYWRHGSLNEDRDWVLGETAMQVATQREDRLREKKDPQPISCPKCKRVRLSGTSGLTCPYCGHTVEKHSRTVIQLDGSLSLMYGDIFKPRRRKEYPGIEQEWRSMYHRARKADMTFLQAESLFAIEHNWQWPPRTLPLMPIDDIGWCRRVQDVPRDRLIPQPPEPEPPLFNGAASAPTTEGFKQGDEV